MHPLAAAQVRSNDDPLGLAVSMDVDERRGTAPRPTLPLLKQALPP